MSRRRAFTLADALVCLAVAGLLPALAGLFQSRERARQTACKSNISNIGKGMAIYSASNMDRFPWMTSNNQWDAATGAAQTAGPSEKTNYNVSALLFMLVRDAQAPGIFVCPSTQDKTDENTKTGRDYHWDFSPYHDGNAEHVSYSYQAPLAGEKGTASGVTSDSNAGLAILADRTPAYAGLKPDFNWAKPEKDDPNTGMSQNHRGAMVNVLFADFHVGESRGRADAGIGSDNIYSAAGMGKDGKPLAVNPGPGSMKLADHRSPDDTFLLGPAKMEKAEKKP